MFTLQNPVLWIIGFPVLVILVFLLRGQFSAETRARPRGASHRPVISGKHGSTVRAAVNAGKPERDRKN